MNDVVKLALDIRHGTVPSQYSASDAKEALRQALIEANGGSSTLTMKSIRSGANDGLFALIEQIIQISNEEGLQANDFFSRYVEYRNRALGDSDVFHIPDDSLFLVSEIAEGSQSIRRQKMEAGSDVTVRTRLRGIKVYEEVVRLMAGRVDLNTFIDTVQRSMTNENLNDIYAQFVKAMNSIEAPYSEGLTATGSFNEDRLLNIIDHIEAATGKTAVIMGARSALRKINTAVVADQARTDMYNMGHYGSFNGTDMVCLKQRHKIGTTNFILPENEVYIMASDDKFIKHVTEGEVLMLTSGLYDNVDLTQEFFMTERTGNAVIMSSVAGIYRMA
jgi:hypothetical protein